MLRKEQNDLLTQTGPQTPMGAMFRSYWIPALLSEELPENDCPPVRVALLSQRLLAFRDSQGRYGLIEEFCAHRGVSLWFGRNEESGIRCPYHGWKYDVTGQCVDVPSEPAENGFCQRIKLKGYPLVEQGGVLWTYMGPADRDGRDVPQLLDSGTVVGGVAGERLRAGARQAAVGAPAGVSGFAGALWPHRGVLRPPRRVALVWA